jgi:hypothetical protein
MNKKFVLISLAGSLLVSTGCTKSRWFTRKDYAESQDPFMETEGVASSSGADKAGRATLDDSSSADSAVADARPLSGPKPIQRVGSTTDPANPGAPISRAVYPETGEAAATAGAPATGATRSYEGTELSGYLQKRRSEMATRTTDTTAQASQAVNTQAAAAKSTASTMTDPARRSPAAQAAALPKLSDEAEGFSNFLSQGARTADSAASTTRQAAATISETENAAADFADFAAQKQAEWSTEVSNAPATVKKTASSAVSSARNSAQAVVDDFVEHVNTPAAGNEFEADQFASEETAMEDETESAQPLIRKAAAASEETEFEANPFEEFEAPAPKAPASKAAAPKPASKAAASKAPAPRTAPAEFEENPFENPFADTPAKTIAPKSSPGKPASAATGAKPGSAKTSATPKAPAKKSAEPTVDDSFGFDSGWKPSHLETP